MVNDMSDKKTPKRILHFDDLTNEDFRRFCEVLKNGRVEISEKIDGSARIEFGVHEGKVWTKSKYGTVKTESSQYPNKSMYSALRAAHEALESRAKQIVESWPVGVNHFVAEVLHTPVPNSIQYGPNAIVVHGVSFAPNVNQDDSVCNSFVNKIGTLGGGKELWRFDYRPSLPPDTFSQDIPDDVDVADMRVVVRDKLIKRLRGIKSAYGPDVEGVVIVDPETGLTTKIVDKDYFTKLNQFLWSWRERLDKGQKVGDEWQPGVMQSFRNSVADDVIRAPIAKTPEFINKLNLFGRDLFYPPEIDTDDKKKHYLLSQWIKKNANPVNDSLAKFEASLKKSIDSFLKIHKEWKKVSSGKIVAEIAGKKIEMHDIVKKRTDDAFAELGERFANMKNELAKIKKLKRESDRHVAITKLMLGERLEKLQIFEKTDGSDVQRDNPDDAVPATSLIKQWKKHIKARGINLDGLKFLGGGGNGSAFLTSDGKVFKITKDETEAKSSEQVAGKDLKHIAKIFQVFEFPTEKGKRYFGILAQFVQPLSKEESQEIDDANFYASLYVNKGWINLTEGEFDETVDAIESWNADNPELIKTVKYAQHVLKRIDAFEMLKELESNGVTWHDLHGGNVGKIGGKYYGFDLGVSDNNNPSVPKLVENNITKLTEAKADTVGVTIGRYQPLHKGHSEIIRKLAKQFTKTIVIIAGNKIDKNNPFSYELRMDMMDLSLSDVVSKIEFHKAEFDGKSSGFLPGVLSDIVKRGGSSIKPGVAVNVLVGPDRLEEFKQQFANAVANKERYGLVFDPSLAVVNALEGVKNDDDTDRISGTKVRQAIVEGNKELVKQMMDPLLVSNETDFNEIYDRMREEMKKTYPQQVKEGVFDNLSSGEISKAFANPQQSSGGKNKYTDEFLNIIKTNEDKLLKKGIVASKLTIIGSGQDGTAFDMGSGKVLKLTVDEGEARSANSLLGKTLKHVARMYDVFKFQEKLMGTKTVYGIVEEKLDMPSGTEKFEFDNFAREFLNPKDDAGKEILMGGDVKAYAQYIAAQLKTGIIKTSNAQDPNSTAKEPGRNQRPIEQRTYEIAKAKYVRFVEMMKKYDIPGIMRDLKAVQIKWMDWHGNNILKRGNDYVIMDLGRSKSAGQEPPLLEKIVDTVIRNISASSRKGSVKKGGVK
jgi:cytidyltransferase-like protein